MVFARGEVQKGRVPSLHSFHKLDIEMSIHCYLAMQIIIPQLSPKSYEYDILKKVIVKSENFFSLRKVPF